MKTYDVRITKVVTFTRTISVQVDDHETSREAEFQARGQFIMEEAHSELLCRPHSPARHPPKRQKWDEVDESEATISACIA